MTVVNGSSAPFVFLVRRWRPSLMDLQEKKSNRSAGIKCLTMF